MKQGYLYSKRILYCISKKDAEGIGTILELEQVHQTAKDNKDAHDPYVGADALMLLIFDLGNKDCQSHGSHSKNTI